MPGPARLITLNLGSQTFGLAEFRVAHGGLTLVNYRLREVPLDPETGHRRDAHVPVPSLKLTRRPTRSALPCAPLPSISEIPFPRFLVS